MGGDDSAALQAAVVAAAASAYGVPTDVAVTTGMKRGEMPPRAYAPPSPRAGGCGRRRRRRRGGGRRFHLGDGLRPRCGAVVVGIIAAAIVLRILGCIAMALVLQKRRRAEPSARASPIEAKAVAVKTEKI